MRSLTRNVAIAALVALAACGDNIENNGSGYGDRGPPANPMCTAPSVSGPARATGAVCPVHDTGGDCSCADYSAGLPEDIFDSNATKVCNNLCANASGLTGATCNDGVCPSGSTCLALCPDNGLAGKAGTAVTGCYTALFAAWPDCAYLAEASGLDALVDLQADSNNPVEDWDDGITICPDFMQTDPFDGGRMEIRNYGAFNPPDGDQTPISNGAVGRIHIEVQDCRYYRGSYALPEGGDPVIAEPTPGDLVSAAGDWVVDDGHGDPSQYSLELHEARIIAKTHKVDDKRFYLLVNSFFTRGTRQERELVLDIQVPNPTGSGVLTCEEAKGTLNGILPAPGIAEAPGVRVKSITGNANPGSPFGFCRVVVENDGTGPITDFQCHGDASDPSNAACRDPSPVFGPKYTQIAWAGAIRATWDDPGDLWLCSCDCDDPSAANAVISAPVQGCAVSGSTSASACQQACGGVICSGASEACEIGSCHPAPGAPPPTLVARDACDTDLQPFVRVGPDGDYRTDVDPSRSYVTFKFAGVTTAPVPVNGAIHFNLSSGSPQLVEFSDISLIPNDFSVKGHDVRGAAIVTVQRVYGQIFSTTGFEIPAGVGSFAARGTVDGDPAGVNVVNPQTIVGTIDLGTLPHRFSVDFDARDPQHSDRALTAHIEGLIDDHPPDADASRTPARVECTTHTVTPVTLDGTASSDSDPGDAIAHFQWFGPAGGLGNTSIAHVALPVAQPTEFSLHVYDRELGAAEATKTVTVVDTTPPQLSVSPTRECLRPPNHKMTCYAINTDIHASVSDVCDPHPIVRVSNVSSDQPANGIGDGDTDSDVSWTDDTFCVRNERTGGTSRTYTVVIEARDASGNKTTQDVRVVVPQGVSCSP